MLNTFLNAKNVEKNRAFLAGMLNQADIDRDMEVEAYKERRSTYGHFDAKGERLTTWAESRDSEFLSEIQEEFGVGSLVSVTITATEGKGSVLMDGMVLPSASYKAKFFAGNTMELTAIPAAGAVFGGWTGCEPVPNVPEKCIATVAEGASVTATFK